MKKGLENMELEKCCFNCNFFVPDKIDFDAGYGACMYDIDAFEPFVDEVMESNDFSCCREAYNKNRVEDSSICENFEEVEIIEVEDGATLEEINAELLINRLKNQKLDGVEDLLVNGDLDRKRRVVSELESLIYMGNPMAYDLLLDYFIESEPAKNIEEVHLRVEIIELLRHKANEERLAEVYVDELLKTPSNNTTRQIYTKIFDYFNRCSIDTVREPLTRYLEIGNCSPKIKKKVKDILEKEERHDMYQFFRFDD